MRGKNFLRHVARDPQGRFLDSITMYHGDEREVLLSEDVRRALNGWNSEAYFGAPFERLKSLPLATQMMAFDFETYLPDDVLTKVDRMSMAVSLETREPLLDHKLLEYVATIPASLKLHNGTTKYLLRKLLQRRLPASIIQRPKHGFEAPIGKWLAGPLRNVGHEILFDGRLAQRGVIADPTLKQLWNEHCQGRGDHRHRLWAVMMLELWFRQFIDASSAPARLDVASLQVAS